MRFALPKIKTTGHASPVVEKRQIIGIFIVWKMLHEVLAPPLIMLFHLHLGTEYIRDLPCTNLDQLGTHSLPTVLQPTMLIKDGNPNSSMHSFPGFRKV